MSAPKSVVVIHGVGDQVEEDTVRDLARAVGRSLRPGTEWPPPMLITKVADVRCDARQDGDAEVFTVTAYEVAALGQGEAKESHRLPLYEFWWSNLSNAGSGFLGELRQSWQCLVGLPRIGFQALTRRPSTPAGRRLLAATKVAFVLAWLLIVVRMVVSLLLILAFKRLESQGQLNETWLRYYDVVFLLDLSTYTVLLAYSVLRGAFAFVDRGATRRTFVSGMTLAVTLLLTQALPLTLLEFTGLDVKVYTLRPWLSFAEPPPGSPVYSYGPAWFYYINSVPGFFPYLIDGLIAVWAILAGLAYGLLVRGAALPDGDRAAADRVEGRMNQLVRLSIAFWRIITVILLVVVPIFWWIELLHLRFMGRGLESIYVPFEGDAGFFQLLRANPLQAIVDFWVMYVATLALTAVWVILTVPPLRRQLAPLLELIFDVSNYFPSVPGIDDHTPTRMLLGGQRRPPHFGSLRQALTIRLRELLQFAHRRHDGPVVVVAHSLGTIIALAALDDWPPGPKGPWVDLVTMGSPFNALNALFPHLYGHERAQGGWSLPAVRRWLNVYRAGDPVGRRVDFAWAGEPHGEMPENELVGNGGHVGYFGDDAVAARLVAWTGLAPIRQAGLLDENGVTDRRNIL